MTLAQVPETLSYPSEVVFWDFVGLKFIEQN